MLRAHYNMPAADFIAQLRTYVIAMGLSPQVVDAVDNLCGADEFDADSAEEMRGDILEAVKKYFDEHPSPLAEKLKVALVTVIEDA